MSAEPSHASDDIFSSYVLKRLRAGDRLRDVTLEEFQKDTGRSLALGSFLQYKRGISSGYRRGPRLPHMERVQFRDQLANPVSEAEHALYLKMHKEAALGPTPKPLSSSGKGLFKNDQGRTPSVPVTRSAKSHKARWRQVLSVLRSSRAGISDKEIEARLGVQVRPEDIIRAREELDTINKTALATSRVLGVPSKEEAARPVRAIAAAVSTQVAPLVLYRTVLVTSAPSDQGGKPGRNPQGHQQGFRRRI
jgi:hypothetical protein